MKTQKCERCGLHAHYVLATPLGEEMLSREFCSQQGAQQEAKRLADEGLISEEDAEALYADCIQNVVLPRVDAQAFTRVEEWVKVVNCNVTLLRECKQTRERVLEQLRATPDRPAVH